MDLFEEQGIVTVPDLTAAEHWALARNELQLTTRDDTLEAWDYDLDQNGGVISGRGKRFKSLMRNPSYESPSLLSADEVREDFQHLGYHGHIGALIAWRRAHPERRGLFATIPEERQCWRQKDGALYTLDSRLIMKDREFNFRRLKSRWEAFGWRFIGFQELSD